MSGRLQALQRTHPVLLIAGGLFAVFTLIAALPWLVMAGPGAAGAVWLARKRKPGLPLRHFVRSRGIVLTALGGFASVCTIQAMDLAYAQSLVAAAALALLALAIAYLVFEISGGKIMKSIMELVPAGQQGRLAEFVGGTPAGAGGQAADLSALDPAAVADSIRARIIGQDDAVRDSVSLIFRRARLRRPNKPIATLLLVGATGAGKTELAKALAVELFRGRLIRVDCNEMSQPQSTQRLIGAPPGYVGSDAGGWLCRELARTGSGVLLFDEIEKAHPDVLTLIMGLLDEARLTEQSTGQTYNATAFLIVLTSNAAHETIAKIITAHPAGPERTGLIKAELQATGMRPEVLARVDAVQAFAALDRAAVVEIVGRFLLQFASDAGLELVSVDAGLLIDLVQRREKLAGYGVREVVRLVESAVVDGLLDVRDAGFRRAAITLDGDAVRVAGVA